MTWEEGIEPDNTVAVRRLNTTEEGLIDIRCVGRVAVATSIDT
jgi:hypothetical protein